MSADEFDADIERLFAQTPRMADADLFAARVETRLASGSRLRATALTGAGLIGGVFAVRESLKLNFALSPGHISAGTEAAAGNVTDVAHTLVDQIGLSGAGFGALGGMQLFWIVAATLVFVAAAGVVKLSQEA